jgi:hypothetical protein
MDWHAGRENSVRDDAYEAQPAQSANQSRLQGMFPPAYDPTISASAQGNDTRYEGETFYDGSEPLPQGEEGYDDGVLQTRPRRGLKTIMVLAGLAILGTGGAFAYRTMFGAGGPVTPPPVIRADTTPTKVVPAQSGEASNKLIYDRVGETGQGEKVVSREEQPIEVRDSSRPNPRIVFPPLLPSTARADASAMSSPLGGLPSVGPASAEPKKIRTVAIRPDQPLETGATKPATTPRGNTVATATPSNIGVPPAIAPRPAVSAPASALASAPAPAATAAIPAPAPAGNAPLSLSPGSTPDVASRPAPPTRVATAPAAAPATPSRPALASGAPEAAAGSYTVQLSSQRSETDAQASFRALQSKFPNLLSDRQPIIRRADLGDKGIYFRAMVGPFASADQATQFCGSLKSAGGQCVVQRN